MKVFELKDGFGLEHLRPAERPEPQPRAGEVVVRLRAASLNFRDWLMVQGKYDPNLAMPRVPLSDGAGEIAAVGAGVTAWRPGDRVVIPFMPGWLEGPLTAEKSRSALGGAADGVLAQFIAVPGAAPLPVPAHLDFDQAAALPCAAVTAWNGLFAAARLQPGETVLLQGTGGVSLFGLQLAKAAGATAILISSSDDKLARARALGADHLVNYRARPDWEKEVFALTGRRGADVILEVGGTGTLSRSLRAAAFGGRISQIGVLTGIAGQVELGSLLHKSLLLHGIYVGSRAMFADLNRTLETHRIAPVIDRVFPFAEAPRAIEHLASGRHFGKIVVRID